MKYDRKSPPPPGSLFFLFENESLETRLYPPNPTNVALCPPDIAADTGPSVPHPQLETGGYTSPGGTEDSGGWAGDSGGGDYGGGDGGGGDGGGGDCAGGDGD